MAVETRSRLGLQINTYLPNQRLTNEVIETWRVRTGGTDDKPKFLTAAGILKKTGISQRPIAAPGETVVDMAIKATEPLVRENPKVDFVIFSTSYPTGRNNALEIIDHFGLRPKGYADIHAACTGYVYALRQIALDGDYFAGSRILLLASEKYSPTVVDLRQGRDPSLSQTIFGDGAAATSLVCDKNFQILSHDEFRDFPPEQSRALTMPVDANLAVQPAVYEKIPYSEKFWMDGKVVFEAVVKSVPDLIKETVRRSGLSEDQVDLIVPHQASRHMLEGIRKRLDTFDPNIFVINLSKGNPSSASIPIALQEATVDGRGRSKKKLILAGFGAELLATVVVAEVG